MSKQWFTCNKCGKKLSSYHSLWRHKKKCNINDGENISSKRRSEDDVPYETNPIVQAFVDGIINGPPKSSVIQKEDDFHSSTIADNDVFQPFGNADEERVLPISKYDKPSSREHKLPSPTTSVVDSKEHKQRS